MPDLPNRQEEEALLTYLLLAQFEEFADDAIGLLGNPPRMANLPPGYFSEIAGKIRGAVVDQFAGLNFESARRMADSIGFPFNEAAAAREAESWAEQRAAQLASDFIERLEKQLRDAVQSYEVVAAAEGESPAMESIVLFVSAVFSADRAAGISITETTGAVSAGEDAEADRIEREYGVELIAIWVTENDVKVCRICENKAGETDESPPAHPKCRCRKEWMVRGMAPFSEN